MLTAISLIALIRTLSASLVVGDVIQCRCAECMYSTLRAVNRVTVDELNDGDSCIRQGIQFAAQHL